MDNKYIVANGWQAEFFDSEGPYWLGHIPMWINPLNTRPVKEQLDANYQHGGGWSPMKGFQWVHPEEGKIPEDLSIVYKPNDPDSDPPMKPRARLFVKDGVQVIVYPHEWIMIAQKDGSFEICRMD